MKPVMESEMFVANEYVAACWVVTCISDENHGSMIYKSDTEINWSTSDNDAFFTHNNINYYTGTINNNKGSTNNIEWDDSSLEGIITSIFLKLSVRTSGAHKVDVTKISSSGIINEGTTYEQSYGPNAS